MLKIEFLKVQAEDAQPLSPMPIGPIDGDFSIGEALNSIDDWASQNWPSYFGNFHEIHMFRGIDNSNPLKGEWRVYWGDDKGRELVFRLFERNW